jgi:error-prone DNA polymerase
LSGISGDGGINSSFLFPGIHTTVPRIPRPPAYAELRAASAFSFLDGASTPETLAETAAALSIPSVALLDRDGVYGAPRFHQAARKAGLRAHVGAEVSCALDGPAAKR